MNNDERAHLLCQCGGRMAPCLDYERAFGRTPPEIIGIGLMTDTDNTGAEVTAYYGDIRLISAW
jgi:hypothetical protein